MSDTFIQVEYKGVIRFVATSNVAKVKEINNNFKKIKVATNDNGSAKVLTSGDVLKSMGVTPDNNTDISKINAILNG